MSAPLPHRALAAPLGNPNPHARVSFIGMTGTLTISWSLSFIAEAMLMFHVWRRLRATYTSFFLYLLADLSAALFMAGTVLLVPHSYSAAWISLELILAAFQFAVSIEAFRRANSLLRFAPRMLLVVVLVALAASTIIWLLLKSPNPWPHDGLVPANSVRAVIEMFLGLSLLFLVTLPGRASCLLKFQGRHLMILSIYLIISSILLFLEDHLYTQGSSIPATVFMLTTAGFCLTWTLLIPRSSNPPISMPK